MTRSGATNPDVADGVRQEWIADQREDPIIGRVYAWVEGGVTPTPGEIGAEGYPLKSLVAQLARLEIKEGLFVPGSARLFQIVVPEKRKEEVWAASHGGGVIGHLGWTRTIRRLQEWWYWPEFRREVTYWVATCPRCLERKLPPHPHRSKMGHIPIGLPLERMGIDVMGPLPATARGNKYVVVMVDYFTKWAEAVCTPNQEAATVARVLVETVVCRLGAPATLHSDQGRNFQSRLFREVVRLLEMQQTRTCAFNPKSDGLVERCNRTIEALLSTVVADDHSDWERTGPVCHGGLLLLSEFDHRSHPQHDDVGEGMLGRETTPPCPSYTRMTERRWGRGWSGTWPNCSATWPRPTDLRERR